MMRLSDGNAGADDILEWDGTDSDPVDELQPRSKYTSTCSNQTV